MKVRKKAVEVYAEPYSAGLEDGWEYEDQLPPDCDYDAMYPLSKVDGVRLFPFVNTLEGRYFLCEDDWIITGQKGERWPISTAKFDAIYETKKGSVYEVWGAGRYVSKPLERDAIKMPNDFTVHCSGGDLRGAAGSWLVLATPDDAYPVEAAIFDATYETV